jgi:hypothetical protein
MPIKPTISKEAFHEAGHAFVAHFFGMRLIGVSITAIDETKGGVANYSDPHRLKLELSGALIKDTQEHDEYVYQHIMVDLAGEAAQMEFSLTL